MKTAIKVFFATIFLCTLAAMSLYAQTNAAAETPGSVLTATNSSTTDPNQVEENSINAGTRPVEGGVQALTAIVAIMAGCSIPIAIVAVVGLGFYFRLRKNRMLHETLRAMIDKGVPIPPELLSKSEPDQTKRPRSDFRNGLIFIGAGIGTVILAGKPGYIILFMGVAFLVASFFEKKSDSQPPKP
jgi:hypothetical protein